MLNREEDAEAERARVAAMTKQPSEAAVTRAAAAVDKLEAE